MAIGILLNDDSYSLLMSSLKACLTASLLVIYLPSLTSLSISSTYFFGTLTVKVTMATLIHRNTSDSIRYKGV